MKKIVILSILTFLVGCKNYTTQHLVKTEKGIYRFYTDNVNLKNVETEFCKADKNLDNVEKCKPVKINYGF